MGASIVELRHITVSPLPSLTFHWLKTSITGNRSSTIAGQCCASADVVVVVVVVLLFYCIVSLAHHIVL